MGGYSLLSFDTLTEVFFNYLEGECMDSDSSYRRCSNDGFIKNEVANAYACVYARRFYARALIFKASGC